MIPSPNTNPKDDDKECQDAIEPAVLELIDMAVASGWKKSQVVKALSDLSAGLWFDEQRFPDQRPDLPAVGLFPLD